MKALPVELLVPVLLPFTYDIHGLNGLLSNQPESCLPAITHSGAQRRDDLVNCPRGPYDKNYNIPSHRLLLCLVDTRNIKKNMIGETKVITHWNYIVHHISRGTWMFLDKTIDTWSHLRNMISQFPSLHFKSRIAMDSLPDSLDFIILAHFGSFKIW